MATIRRTAQALSLLVATLLLAPSTHAQSLAGGVDFGAAGPQNWGILEINGQLGMTGGAGYSCGGGVRQGACTGGSPVTNANVGFAGTATANGWGGGGTEIDGEAVVNSGNITNVTAGLSGIPVTGGIVQNNTLLSNAATAAANAITTAEGLACTGTLCSITSLTSGQTLTPVNPGGQNVLAVNNINLGNGAVVTLGGVTGTNWVILDTGGFNLNGTGSILVGANLNPTNNLTVVEDNTNLSSSGGSGNPAVFDGVLVEANASATSGFTPITVNGEVIGEGNLKFASGATIITVNGLTGTSVPEPASLPLLLSGLAALGFVARRAAKTARNGA